MVEWTGGCVASSCLATPGSCWTSSYMFMYDVSFAWYGLSILLFLLFVYVLVQIKGWGQRVSILKPNEANLRYWTKYIKLTFLYKEVFSVLQKHLYPSQKCMMTKMLTVQSCFVVLEVFARVPEGAYLLVLFSHQQPLRLLSLWSQCRCRRLLGHYSDQQYWYLESCISLEKEGNTHY